MDALALAQLLDKQLNCQQFQDYAPNGLQVAGRSQVNHIITGVTACQALLDAAVAQHADAVMVHHGYFWKNESPVISQMKKRRLATLLNHDINLYAYHLPLDAHPTLGNNAQLAQQLAITVQGELLPLVPYGSLTTALSAEQLSQRLSQKLQRQPFHCAPPSQKSIKRLAWCSGAGQNFLLDAANAGMDAFITGEVSEQTVHIAREMDIHFFAAGHHATERGGIQALGNYLASQHGLIVTFVDIDNPV